MKFKGTIVITDPCYLDHNMPQENNWWKMVECGNNLEATGINHYICESTVYGDWSCITYKGNCDTVQQKIKDWNKYYFNFLKNFNSSSEEDKNNLHKEYKKFKNEFISKYALGEFCADAGLVCVVYLDDILKFNPDFYQWAKCHPWCVTIIEDFDGNIEYEIDKNDEAHIVGKGNINFYTSQSGL